MPSRNTLKEFAASQYYHVYNRGVEKRDIFLTDNDYSVFVGLLKKYLAGENDNLQNRHKFMNLADEVDLIAYCLMPNHFHLLLYQKTEDGITKLMRRVITGYVMYFNSQYRRVGFLFQSRYKASLINSDDYLHHITRYIHLNPPSYLTWPYSSLDFYKGTRNAKWVNKQPIMDLFNNDSQKYLEFVRDYEDSQKELASLKWQLANDPEDM